MNGKQWFSKSILVGLLLSIATPAVAEMDASLLEMSEQMDGIDKQDFQAAIDKANACTRARNFPCTESELAKAAKAANSGQDKKTLLAGRNGLANEKQQLALEIRRAEEERRAQIRREEEEQLAQRHRDEEREAREWRDKRDAQEAEDRQATRDAWANVGTQIQQNAADISSTMANINRQTTAANNEANRVRAAQSAERERVRAEKADQEADRRRAAERDRAARADAQRTALAKAAESQTELPKYKQQAVSSSDYRSATSTAPAPRTPSSSASLPSATSSSSSSSQLSGTDSDSYKYVYIKDDFFKTWSRVSAEEGCKRLNETAANAARNPLGLTGGVTVERFLSSGTCSCTDNTIRDNFVSFDCRIPKKVEIKSAVPLNGGPSTGISK
jgi:hypothetical protein